MLTHALLFSLNYFLKNESRSCQSWNFQLKPNPSHANQKGSLENVDIVYRALISLLNNFNVLTEMFLKSHNEIKQKYFLVAGTFTLRLFRKKVHQGTKEKKVARIKYWNSESCRLWLMSSSEIIFEMRKSFIQESTILNYCMKENIICIPSCLIEKRFFRAL